MDDVREMAAFVAIEIAANEGADAAREWLASVIEEPAKWQREARAFALMTDNDDAGAYSYESAAVAVYTLMGPSNAS